MMASSLTTQIQEVEREIALRRNVYPRQVSKRAMSQSASELLIERMEDVLNTLLWLERNETEVRAYVAAKKASIAELLS